MKQNKIWFLISSIFIIIIIAVPIGWILHQENNPNGDDNEPSFPDESVGLPELTWQVNLKDFATGLLAKEERVYTIDISGNIICYDTTDGHVVWEGSVGGYFSEGLVVNQDRVYGGAGVEVVGCLDIRTGSFYWGLAEIPNIKYYKVAPENFTVVDGRLFVKTNAFSVFNATTGKLLWLVEDWGNLPGQSEQLWSFNGWAFENDLLICSSSGSEGIHINRLNPDDGTIMWATEGLFFDSPVVYHEQVIIKNSSKAEILSLDASSGKKLWSYDVGATICSLKEYNGRLLFFVSDNCFYALNLDNGTLAWKSAVDSQEITALVNDDNPLEGLPVLIDQQKQTMVGVVAVTTQDIIDEHHVEDKHYGLLCNLDLNNGNVVWTEHFSGQGDISNEYLVFDYAATRNHIYLTDINELLIFDKQTGLLIETQHFEHKITAPTVENEKAFVAADLWLFAYK